MDREVFPLTWCVYEENGPRKATTGFSPFALTTAMILTSRLVSSLGLLSLDNWLGMRKIFVEFEAEMGFEQACVFCCMHSI